MGDHRPPARSGALMEKRDLFRLVRTALEMADKADAMGAKSEYLRAFDAGSSSSLRWIADELLRLIEQDLRREAAEIERRENARRG